MMVFYVTGDNYKECIAVIKHILWMYLDMITNYCGFGHNIDFEEINYEKYFFTESIEDGYLKERAMLISQGALIALCCEVQNLLDEEQRSEQIMEIIRKLLSEDKINKMHFEKELLTVMELALREERHVSWESQEHGSRVYEKFKEVYAKYVLGFYEQMLKAGKPS